MNPPTTLHVHLQEGFESERVVVAMDNTVVFDEPTVRTKTQTGLAQMLEFDAPTNPVSLRVEFAARGRNATIAVDTRKTPYVGVSVGSDGGVLIKTQTEPFGYL